MIELFDFSYCLSVYVEMVLQGNEQQWSEATLGLKIHVCQQLLCEACSICNP